MKNKDTKDLVMKDFEAYPDVAADLLNVFLHEGQQRAMYLFANQSRVDSKMLFRKAGYVGGAYREQYKSRKNAFFQVIELVLYWGEERWNCRESLHELLHNRDASETLLKFTDNLKLR